MYFLANRHGFVCTRSVEDEPTGQETYIADNVRHAKVFSTYTEAFQFAVNPGQAFGPFTILRPSMYRDAGGVNKGMFLLAVNGGFIVDLEETRVYDDKALSAIRFNKNVRAATVFSSEMEALDFCRNTIIHNRYHAVLLIAYNEADVNQQNSGFIKRSSSWKSFTTTFSRIFTPKAQKVSRRST